MRVPLATYRLQVNEAFTFDDARRIVRYLADLGISDLYLSPIWEARSGSTHGYDVVDPNRIREAAGGAAGFEALAAEARNHDMGVLLDIVPNHMAASMENPWWRDVVRYGADSDFAHVFDVDWGTPGTPRRLALPILGDSLDVLIQRNELRIEEDTLVYHDHRIPLLEAPDEEARRALDDPARRADALRAVIGGQQWELVHWQAASRRMSYRRFFDITDLVGVRVEDERVFRLTHELVQRLAAAGLVTGLRIDHIDGLRDPAGYLRMLREYVRGPDGEPVYTVVEKILEQDEQLPADWACEGTTGYEFLSIATGALVKPEGHRVLDQFYQRLSGDVRSFGDLVHEKKLLVIERLFGSELASLANGLTTLTGLDDNHARRGIVGLTAGMHVYRTYTSRAGVREDDRQRIRAAEAEAIARDPDAGPWIRTAAEVALLEFSAPADEQLEWVLRWQQFTGPVMAKGFEDTALYCHNALLAVNEVGSNPSAVPDSMERVSGLLAARRALLPRALSATATHDTKRGEDTRARIAVLSEIPDRWRSKLRRWIRTGDEWKAEMVEDDDVATPGADVDSLLYQTLIGAWPISGADDEYRQRIQAYMTKAVREAKEQTSWRRPDEDFEQALQDYINRLMAGFGREGLADEVAALATEVAPHGVLNSLTQMLLRIMAPGVPDFYQGTELWSFTLVDPDNRTPVDFTERQRAFRRVRELRDVPDARRVRELLENWESGEIKLLFAAMALRFRAALRDTFATAPVLPLPATGDRRDNVLAFARGTGDHACIIVLPRWTMSLREGTTLCTGEVWQETRIPLPDQLQRPWYNALTGETFETAAALDMTGLFASVPFALLRTSQPVGA